MENKLTAFCEILVQNYEKSNQRFANLIVNQVNYEKALYREFINSDSQVDQNLLADVDNIFLYFSPKGMEMWSKKQIDGMCYTTIERLKLELTKC